MIVIILIVLIPVFNSVDFDTKEGKVSALVIKESKVQKPEIVDGIHIESGLIVNEGWEAVNTNCTRCHSATIVTNSRFTREGWKELIVWMQETQGLWQLGANEDVILDYLSKNYSPIEKKGRRQPLKIKDSDWYMLD